MNNVILAEESFACGSQRLYVGYKQAVNGNHYLTLARLDKRYKDKWASVNIFEENLPNFIEALSSVFQTAAFQAEMKTASGDLFQPAAAARGIKSWEPEQRPREKLMEQGREAMSDAELLAMLICAGLPGLTAVDLAERVLSLCAGELSKLAALKVEELMTIRGIGHARALSIISAMELAVRLAAREQPLHYLKIIRNG